MLVRVKLHGTGTHDDPYRANLPTYGHIHGNVTHGWMIVNIPEEVHPLTPEELAEEEAEETTNGVLYPSLSEKATRKLHEHFDAQYSEHKGKFRIEPA